MNPKFSENNHDNKISDVTPGQLITKDPTITVKAGSEASYLRAKIDIEGLSEEDAELIEDTLDINRELWVPVKKATTIYNRKLENEH